MLKKLIWLGLFLALVPSTIQAQQTTQERLSDIIGPVIPLGESPWPGYDDVFEANVFELGTAALAAGATPTLGAALTGTFTFADGCPVTLTGAGASDVSNGDWLVVAWNAPDGNGTGRFVFHNVTVAGNVISAADRCGLAPGLVAGSGLTVYRCASGCRDDTAVYKAGGWGLNAGSGAAGWNYYDFGLAVYRLYLRTNDTQYLTMFRSFTDIWWQWALDQGSVGFTAPRSLSIVSQFVRALDGETDRLPVLFDMIEHGYIWSGIAAVTPPKFDARESGYLLMFLAVGARADEDPVRRAAYCTMLVDQAEQWVATQNVDGYWSEKNGGYAYRTPGTSPWRMFAPLQGLARAYEVLIDEAVCNDPTLAADVLAAVAAGTDYSYEAGRADNRGIYYDTEYPNEGQEGTNNGTKVGTVSATLSSTQVVGVNTTFLSTFNCDGTDWIGLQHTDGYTWTFRVESCADNTHLTLDKIWGDTGEATTNASGILYYQTDSASTDCGSSIAATCWSGFDGSPVPGDRNSARDLIWAQGWMFDKTGDTKYKTRGDELFAASYSFPAAGYGANYPGSPGPCAGPDCDDVITDWAAAVHSCIVSTVTPCNPDHNGAGGNAYDLMGKRFNQGSGIGGADNYLAWRLGEEVEPEEEEIPPVGVIGSTVPRQ